MPDMDLRGLFKPADRDGGTLQMVDAGSEINLSYWAFGTVAELSDGSLVQFVGLTNYQEEFPYKFVNTAKAITRLFSKDGRNMQDPTLKITRRGRFSPSAKPTPPESESNSIWRIPMSVDEREVLHPTSPAKRDPWQHRSQHMRCSTCMWFALKAGTIGRCRRHAPSLHGFPVVKEADWCGDHRLDETKEA